MVVSFSQLFIFHTRYCRSLYLTKTSDQPHVQTHVRLLNKAYGVGKCRYACTKKFASNSFSFDTPRVAWRNVPCGAERGEVTFHRHDFSVFFSIFEKIKIDKTKQDNTFIWCLVAITDILFHIYFSDPSPVTRHPSPATRHRHPSPATRHPLPTTRGKVLPSH